CRFLLIAPPVAKPHICGHESSQKWRLPAGFPMPFLTLEDEKPGDPEVVLKQVGPNSFQLLHGFRYQAPDSGVIYLVPAHDPSKPPTAPNNSTDLASVPFWLWRFV